MKNAAGDIVEGIGSKETLTVIPHLYNSNGDEVNIENQVTYTWHYAPTDPILSFSSASTGSKCYIKSHKNLLK
jgi:hypothetical protein